MTWEGLNPPYRTLVADPPWPHQPAGSLLQATKEHRPLSWNNTYAGVSAATRYSLLSLDDLAALSVGTLADVTAHLYLWTTNAFMVEAHDLARAWGFAPKTILTWVKVHHADPERVSMKVGYWFRGSTEHIIFATRGKQTRLQTREALPTAYLWPRVDAHSDKPAAFFDLVEKASPGPYVELFARQPRFGWDSWGTGYENAGVPA